MNGRQMASRLLHKRIDNVGPMFLRLVLPPQLIVSITVCYDTGEVRNNARTNSEVAGPWLPMSQRHLCAGVVPQKAAVVALRVKYPVMEDAVRSVTPDSSRPSSRPTNIERDILL